MKRLISKLRSIVEGKNYIKKEGKRCEDLFNSGVITHKEHIDRMILANEYRTDRS